MNVSNTLYKSHTLLLFALFIKGSTKGLSHPLYSNVLKLMLLMGVNVDYPKSKVLTGLKQSAPTACGQRRWQSAAFLGNCLRGKVRKLGGWQLSQSMKEEAHLQHHCHAIIPGCQHDHEQVQPGSSVVPKYNQKVNFLEGKRLKTLSWTVPSECC